MSCPICEKPSQNPYAPFCSRRCADVDLGRWLTGSYVIEGGPEDEAEPAETTPPDARETQH